MITQAELKKLLHYDPGTGDFTWKSWRKNQVNAGDIAGCVHKSSFGYMIIELSAVKYKAHRLAWFYVHGEWPEQVDHLNGIRDDNRMINLRNVTHTENQRNRIINSNNTSGYNGVAWVKHLSKWYAYIRHGGKRINLGYYKDKEKAVKVRQMADVLYGYHPNHGKAKPSYLRKY